MTSKHALHRRIDEFRRQQTQARIRGALTFPARGRRVSAAPAVDDGSSPHMSVRVELPGDWTAGPVPRRQRVPVPDPTHVWTRSRLEATQLLDLVDEEDHARAVAFARMVADVRNPVALLDAYHEHMDEGVPLTKVARALGVSRKVALRQILALGRKLEPQRLALLDQARKIVGQKGRVQAYEGREDTRVQHKKKPRGVEAAHKKKPRGVEAARQEQDERTVKGLEALLGVEPGHIRTLDAHGWLSARCWLQDGMPLPDLIPAVLLFHELADRLVVPYGDAGRVVFHEAFGKLKEQVPDLFWLHVAGRKPVISIDADLGGERRTITLRFLDAAEKILTPLFGPMFERVRSAAQSAAQPTLPPA
jgi:hypothetical protein